ncbi:MAG: dihydroneopterin triphosphate diphosphatase [Betaproteobacteria bacterium]|nr:dihydroneopterin triphosphate diphosphatase [Betaproteobacteria bacterium]MBI2961605.1 dihydroneopterin triphosphate diphosphatase [Betaproteobacteria bacterium]
MRKPDSPRYKIPISVLVVIHTPALEVLLIERNGWPGFWQSVTGSLAREDETLAEAAVREVREETGIDAARYPLKDWNIRNRFEIFARRRGRYAPGVTHNTENVFGLTVPAPLPVVLAPEEHLQYQWLPWREAAAKCISWSNREAIQLLPRMTGCAG